VSEVYAAVTYCTIERTINRNAFQFGSFYTPRLSRLCEDRWLHWCRL